MSRYKTEQKQRLHLGKTLTASSVKRAVLVQSVTYAYKCPICHHSHFEICSFGLLRCFMCSTTFREKELIKKCGNS